MKDMQTKILDLLEQRISDAEHEPVVRFEWSNTGDLYAQRGVRSDLVIGFAFQQRYCSMLLEGPAVDHGDLVDAPPVWRLEARPRGGRGSAVAFHHLDYSDSDRIEELLKIGHHSAVVAASGGRPGSIGSSPGGDSTETKGA